MLEKIREKLVETLDVDPSEINLDTNFKEDLGADSLDLFEMIMSLEDEYNLEFPAEELEEIKTVNDVIQYMTSKGVQV